jgi:hypothetical protein
LRRERREKIREEIISTEKSYVASLEVLENNFIKPLKKDGMSWVSLLAHRLWSSLGAAFLCSCDHRVIRRGVCLCSLALNRSTG